MKKLWKFEWYMPNCLCIGLFKATDSKARRKKAQVLMEEAMK